MAIATKYDQHSEDIFSDTRMSFGEHIEDLRAHLLRAIYGFVIALLLSFFIGKMVVGFIARPVEIALGEYWERYYKERSEQVLRDLAAGDSQLQQYNRPQDVELYIAREGLRPGLPDAPRAERPVLHAKLAFEALLERADP